jgi:hypothetical protein
MVDNISGKFIGQQQDYYPSSMCVDPALMHLVLSFYEFDSNTYQYKLRQEPLTQQNFKQVNFLMEKYQMDFGYILNCKIHPKFASGQSISFI